MSKEFDFLKNVRKWRRMKKKVDKGAKGTVMQYYTPTEIEDLLNDLCIDLETAKTEYGSMKATAEKYQVMYNELNYKKNPPVDPNGPIVLIEYESPEARHMVIECPDCHARFYPDDIISSYEEYSVSSYYSSQTKNKEEVGFYGSEYINVFNSEFTCPLCQKVMRGNFANLIETDWDEMKKGLKTKKEVTTVTWEDEG